MNPVARKPLSKKDRKRMEISLHNADYNLAKLNERVVKANHAEVQLTEIEHAGNVGKSIPVLLKTPEGE